MGYVDLRETQSNAKTNAKIIEFEHESEFCNPLYTSTMECDSMQRLYIYIILLLNVSCNTKHSSENSESLRCEERLADEKIRAQECVDRIDTGIEIFTVTEQWAENQGLRDFYQTDPEFAKWCVLFHDIPGNPPYSFQQKRLSQPIPDRYYPCPFPSSEDILESKNSSRPAGLMVNARGFLPGEKVTLRLASKDAYREVTFYPRPLLLKKETGALLAKATLLCAESVHTLYELDICGIGEQEKCKLISYSGEEILSHNFQGPIICGITPEAIGQASGVANIVLHFEDGTFYSMELPWGYELLEYRLGNK